jgi:tRNA (guanine9-N1)-methyltransferase
MTEECISAFSKESESWLIFQSTQCYSDLFPQPNLVYLTADASETAEELDPNQIYIIGGLVDHNRLKGICHQKAVSQGISVRSLPISSYLEGSTRRVLTVNQVFDILVEYTACKSWQTAFERIIPPRKGFKAKQS